MGGMTPAAPSAPSQQERAPCPFALPLSWFWRDTAPDVRFYQLQGSDGLYVGLAYTEAAAAAIVTACNAHYAAPTADSDEYRFKPKMAPTAQPAAAPPCNKCGGALQFSDDACWCPRCSQPAVAPASVQEDAWRDVLDAVRAAHIDGYLKADSSLSEYELRRARAESGAIAYVDARVANERHPLAILLRSLARLTREVSDRDAAFAAMAAENAELRAMRCSGECDDNQQHVPPCPVALRETVEGMEQEIAALRAELDESRAEIERKTEALADAAVHVKEAIAYVDDECGILALEELKRALNAIDSAALTAQAAAPRDTPPSKPKCETCGDKGYVEALIETATGAERCPYISEPCPDCTKRDERGGV